MNIALHPHAQARLAERGATEDEVRATVKYGERFPAKFGRAGFRRNSRIMAFGVASRTPRSRWKRSRCPKTAGWSLPC